MVKVVKKSLRFVKKVLPYTALVIYLIIAILPLILLYLDKEIIICGLYNLGLNLKDVLTPWITFCGGGGAAIGVYQMHRRVVAQEKQITLQEKQNRDSRFHSAAELLGKDGESTRISGIYSLYFLAREYHDEYLEPVCKVLCAHIRTITRKKKYKIKYNEKPADEIQTIIDLLFKEDKDGNVIFNDCRKNLKGAFLHGVDFREAILNKVSFIEATLNKVHSKNFRDAKLTNVYFNNAMLTDVYFNRITLLTNVFFTEAKLTNVYFNNAKLTHVLFTEATLENISFYKAKLIEKNSFIGTPLAWYIHYNYYEEITKKDFSLVIDNKIIVKNERKPFL